ncbi:hypothetical protein COV16_05540 [Candidatus Woesearchaeota archaeon CG10_big_fil_rev_8_21_14_0_10_34_8]|nr:MAG: hypothetical protein COV16_05540 [Candidatus Woesearchaeota archaeon CG10_big_fil_rev_8_21_14_0_10_34_8]
MGIEIFELHIPGRFKEQGSDKTIYDAVKRGADHFITKGKPFILEFPFQMLNDGNYAGNFRFILRIYKDSYSGLQNNYFGQLEVCNVHSSTMNSNLGSRDVRWATRKLSLDEVLRGLPRFHRTYGLVPAYIEDQVQTVIDADPRAYNYADYKDAGEALQNKVNPRILAGATDPFPHPVIPGEDYVIAIRKNNRNHDFFMLGYTGGLHSPQITDVIMIPNVILQGLKVQVSFDFKNTYFDPSTLTQALGNFRSVAAFNYTPRDRTFSIQH